MASYNEQLRFIDAIMQLTDFKHKLQEEGFINISVGYTHYDQYHGVPQPGWGELFFHATLGDIRLDASYYPDDGEEGDMVLGDLHPVNGWGRNPSTLEYKSVKEFIDDFDKIKRVMITKSEMSKRVIEDA